jgi:3-oxosteroid 1-dehydrogenase
MTFDNTFDVVVVGSGAAGLATALGAADSGLKVLILESTDKWCGNSAMSGGGLWLPNNPLLRRDGVQDSREEALAYLEATVGDTGRSTSRARKEAFVDGVDDVVLTTERYGVTWARAADYPDYYPELPGGKIGRGIEVKPLDSKVLGAWYESLRVLMPLPAMTDDVWEVQRAFSSVAGVKRVARIGLRAAGGAVTRKRLVGIGAGLATALHSVVIGTLGAELWLNSPLTELIVEDGKVVGARVTKDGRPVAIGANRGVMLAGGGFDYNREWRQRYHGIDGAPSGSPGSLGGPIAAAEQAGAALELMDDAWWGASIAPLHGEPAAFIVGERALPYSLIVDGRGTRFANEAESYVDLGHHMLAHDKDGTYWLIGDRRWTRRYLRTFALAAGKTAELQKAGIVARADTLARLAERIGADPATLTATVDRFNGFARAGVDGDFGRGNSAYDRYYGDPSVRPNPNLGPLEKGPFEAWRIVIGDLGTKGGVVTDEHARALREDGSVIEGLYSAGNNSASVMGRTYPGPGSTIGPATVFGLIAGRHMAAKA